MLNRSASLALSTSVLRALPGKKLDIKRHSPSILYFSLKTINIQTIFDKRCVN